MMSFYYVCVSFHSSRSLLFKVGSLQATGISKVLEDVFTSFRGEQQPHTPTIDCSPCWPLGGSSSARPPGSVIASSPSFQTAELCWTGVCCTLMYTLITVLLFKSLAFLCFLLVSVFPSFLSFIFILFRYTHVHAVHYIPLNNCRVELIMIDQYLLMFIY